MPLPPGARYSGATHARIIAFILLAILGAALGLIWPALSGPFLFDDFPNLQNLREVGDSFSRESVGRYLAAWQGNPGRPLAALSLLIEDRGWPTDPEAFKRNNLLWHLLVGLGVFVLSRQLSRLAGLGEDLANWTALAALAFWLIHPMQLSATMLVVQRMTVFSNGLIVTGLLMYLAALSRTGKQGIGAALLAVGGLAGFASLAFLAKENGPLAFAYAAALNLTLARPLVQRFTTNGRRILWLGTVGMTLLLVASLLWVVRNPADAYAVRDFTLWERLLTQPRVLVDYLGSIMLPSMQAGIFYDDYEISRGLLKPWTTLPSVLLVLGALAAAWLVRRRFPLAAFAVLWFLAGHLIESTVIPLELYFEHRNYLAMLGPVLAVLIALFKAQGDLKLPLRAAAVSWIALTAFVGHQAAKTWGDELTHAEMWAIERPNSTRAIQQLASAHVKIGFFDAASRILQTGIERIPEATELEFQHALLECLSGDATDATFDRLTEIAQTASWARIIPNVISALRQHAASQQCGGTLSPADYRDLTMALIANPDFGKRLESVGYLYNELGMMYLDIGRPADALEPFRRSFEARQDPQVALNEANIAIFLGRFERAESALQRAREVSRPSFQEWLHPLSDRIHHVREQLEREQGNKEGWRQ